MLGRLRDRLLGSPGFQRAAARNAFTRPIARREARALFDLCAGTVYAQTLAACLRLELFGKLAEGPLLPVDLAGTLGEAALAPLLTAAVALRLLEWRRGRVALGPLGAALRANPGIAAMVAHHAMLHADLADPVRLLAQPGSGELARFWAYGTAADKAPYSALMAESLPMLTEQLREAYDFSAHRAVLDVGGGSGAFLAGLLQAHPAMQGTVLDLPEVAAAARARFADAGLTARASAVGGDFRSLALPAGAGCITLVRVLHDHDDAVVHALLLAAHGALADGGTLLIAEPMADDQPVAAYFSVYLRAMGTGRPRRRAEYRRMLREAGFVASRSHATPLPLLCRVVTATKPIKTAPSVNAD